MAARTRSPCRSAELGLRPRFGRKVLEVRPPVDADKGTAVRALVRDAGVSRVLFAGDDTTDLDAFRGLREAGLELAVCVAVASAEGHRPSSRSRRTSSSEARKSCSSYSAS